MHAARRPRLRDVTHRQEAREAQPMGMRASADVAWRAVRRFSQRCVRRRRTSYIATIALGAAVCATATTDVAAEPQAHHQHIRGTGYQPTSALPMYGATRGSIAQDNAKGGCPTCCPKRSGHTVAGWGADCVCANNWKHPKCACSRGRRCEGSNPSLARQLPSEFPKDSDGASSRPMSTTQSTSGTCRLAK